MNSPLFLHWATNSGRAGQNWTLISTPSGAKAKCLDGCVRLKRRLPAERTIKSSFDGHLVFDGRRLTSCFPIIRLYEVGIVRSLSWNT